MKFSLIPLIAACTFLAFCSASSNKNELSENEEQFTIVTIQEYALQADSCVTTWQRYLHQKPTKQKVELFGSMVDVDMGEIEMTSSGSARTHTGTFIMKNGVAESAAVLFDMESFKLAKHQGNGLFDVKKYPNCELNIFRFEKKGNSLIAISSLTIQEKSKDNEFEVHIVKSEKNFSISGTFKINTLDYPLREQVSAKDIYKDEITVDFSLLFAPLSEKKDTIRKS